ncbi:MAG: hypothetical protein IJX88_01575 [Clostridia bacterium]|nr:hypothetical protein [Clostridia bacterium]
MPIGKNAIKRVENNGYSNVKTDAPDMQNSTVIGATSPEVMEMVEKAVTKKPAAKKTTAKKPCAKKPCAKPACEKDGFVRVEVGEDMPYYLL